MYYMYIFASLNLGVFDQHEIEDLLKESIFMKKLNHPNVMQLIGICVDAGSAPYIVLPFMAGEGFLQ